MDIKQLKYFVVSSEMNSFSAAAKVLYTTQSNVSKAIMALENELGSALFVREARGIVLTQYGKKVYQYASKVLDDMEVLENISKYSRQSRLHISTNPSSWFAARFCEFYNLHYDQDHHFHIRNSSTTEILRRIHDGNDEIGFVYVFEHDHEHFQYLLKKNHLVFTKLANVQGMLHIGQKNDDQQNEEMLHDLRYIQMYQDEFTGHEWLLANGEKIDCDAKNIAVITNSDYIMEKMLSDSPLANISGHYSSTGQNDGMKGDYPLTGHQVVYGVVCRDQEQLSPLALEFIQYIQSCFEKDT